MKKASREKTEKVVASKAPKAAKTKEPAKADEAKTEPQKVDKKQLIVGLIILVVALLLLFISFHKETVNETNVSNKQIKETPVVAEKKEVVDKTKIVPAKIVEQKVENVVFVFTATTDTALKYKLYYTTEDGVDFDEDHVVPLEGKVGQNTYSISIPVEKIARFRLNFGTDIGKVTMGDIYLTGTQTVDLNDLFQYRFFQIVDVDNHGDGSFSFEMVDYHAYMEYRPAL